MTDPLAARSAAPSVVAAFEDACAHIGTRATDRLARAHDASHYLLAPLAVAIAADVEEVSRLLLASRAQRIPVTFRSGGTSLSGQAGSDGVLIDTRRNFRRVEVLDGGASVRAQPGATVRAVNARLARHARKLGPDPASEIACTIGGVVANNSSGMSCGTHANTYRTLESAVLVLPSGTVLDTGAPDAGQRLRELEPAIYAGLEQLRDRVRKNPDSVATLRRLHAIKNTMGYGLNALLDYDDPVRILEHLVIGSEGTLAFVAEATFRTLPVLPHVATGLLVFSSIADATASLSALTKAGLATIELMDAAALRVAQQQHAAIGVLHGLQVVDHAALLIEYQEADAGALAVRLEEAADVLSRLPLATPASLVTARVDRANLWSMRKGLFTAAASARPPGTTALLEDIAVPVERLSTTCAALTRMFAAHEYEGSVIFGHAKDGNLHFLLNERFDDARSLARYEAFTEELVSLVLDQGGTLKAEHGTGRIMAPFVRRQYGDELYDVMWELKRLFDSEMLLNPGVLLSDDPHAHTRHLKTAPAVEPEVDRCVECGYCEPVCPSRDLTLTPRERIVLRRELQRARDHGDHALALELEKEYEYDGVQTCAADGMCQTACPVLINTGDLVRRLRADNQDRLAQAAGSASARTWGTVSSIAGAGLTIAAAMPPAVPEYATRLGRRLLGSESVPLYSGDLPKGGRQRRAFTAPDPHAIYFSSCTTAMFGPVGDDGVSDAFQRLCARVGIVLSTPDDIPSLCCGTPWKSKGLTDGYAIMKAKVAASLARATEGGRLPVVCDASSCTEGLGVLLEAARVEGIRVVDAVAYVDEHVLPHLPAARRIESLTIHHTCSSHQLGLGDSLSRVAAAAARSVVVPEDWGCCAFAGDRGMLHPELTAAATGGEASAVRAASTVAHASLNRTCEVGMTRATGKAYRHVLQILDDALTNADTDLEM